MDDALSSAGGNCGRGRKRDVDPNGGWDEGGTAMRGKEEAGGTIRESFDAA